MILLRLYLFTFIALIVLGNTEAQAQSTLLGCDPRVYNQSQAMTDAYVSVSEELIRASYTRPTSAEMMTCADQQAELINDAGGIFANPGSDISASLGPYVQRPLVNDINNILGSASNGINAISNTLNSTFSDVASVFANSIGLSALAPATYDCDMNTMTWLANQCLNLPQVPDLSTILQGKFSEITGEIRALVDPERYAEQVCRAANSSLQGYFGDLNSSLDNAVGTMFDPITDRVNNVNINN